MTDTTDARVSPRLRIVSTSGVPHADVANYRRSPFWRPGMPYGANRAWRDYMAAVVRQIRAGNPDTVLHSGDMVEGRWGVDVDGRGVFGPTSTAEQKRRAIQAAGDVYYPWMKQWWGTQRVMWGMGDHEIGDLGGSGVIPPTTLRYQAHWHWNQVWKRHFGKPRRWMRRGPVAMFTLNPFVKFKDGIVARIRSGDFDWMEESIARARANGVRWVVVQCEIPALGPNRAAGSSKLLLANGDQFWRFLVRQRVDLFLAAEFHADTTYTDGGNAPVHLVHGGRHVRASWLTVDAYDNRLELVLRESVGSFDGSTGRIWAPSRSRVPNHPKVGSARVTGRAVVHSDRRVTDRTGALTEGI